MNDKRPKDRFDNVLLLIAAALIYFFLGEVRDGAIMLIFVMGIINIDIIQEWKTDKTLNA